MQHISIPYAVLVLDHKLPFPSVNNKFIGSVYSNWAENCFCVARKECEAKQWFLIWNMAAETHLWHPALSPPAYLRKQVASCTPSGRGVPEKQMCGRRWRKLTTLHINEAVVSLRGSWQEGWTGVWPAADSSAWRDSGCASAAVWTLVHHLWNIMNKLRSNQNFTWHRI